MSEITRRGFLRKTTVAGSLLVTHGLGKAHGKASPAASPGGVAGMTTHSPIIVITEPTGRDVNPRGRAWRYIEEVLEHAGLFFDQMSLADLPALLNRSHGIALLVGELRLTAEQRRTLSTFVRGGGVLIGIGGTSGLDPVFGVGAKRPLAEGWMKVIQEDHPLTANLRSSLHVFGGFAVENDSATSLAKIESGRQGAKGSAILENQFGKGRAVLLAPDLVFSIVHMQQGLTVLQDGRPPADGSALIDDGELKAEDGSVLDWERDRTVMEADGAPVFLEPISDELRAIILRCIFHGAAHQGVRLPMLWYWPRCLPAVGHISHDTDGNDPDRAVALLEVMNRCDVKSTWCTLFPGGYPKEFHETLKQQGYEIALHYDARTGAARTSWSKKNFVLQHQWLKEEAGLSHITSNKNHYTRWEGRLDFFRWCEQVGIDSDQTRGGSKQGTIGFPLGGSHPYFPLDDETDPPRRLNVLEVNMLTQDLVVVCPREYGKELVDSVLRQHGVAHFLFHPAHIQKAGVADTLSELVQYGRSQGLEWWTNGQIHQWETRRRGVRARFDSLHAVTLVPEKPLSEATLLFLKSETEEEGEAEAASIRVNDQPVKIDRRTLYGFEFDAVTLDLTGEAKVEML
ncbi:MAG: hypothetical protein ACQESR_16205 [Planctomycetota bacterium]